jgi:hypothetical protein
MISLNISGPPGTSLNMEVLLYLTDFTLYHFFLNILQISFFDHFVPSKYYAATPIFIMLHAL